MLPDTATVTAAAPVDAERVWALLAGPASWPAWAPQMRHVEDRDHVDSAPGRVRTGQLLRIHTVVPGVAIPVTITQVDEPTSWTMEAQLPVGTVRSSHTVADGAEGTVVTVTLQWLGPRLAGPVVLTAYRPVAMLAVSRLLRLAGAEGQGATVARSRMCGRDPEASHDPGEAVATDGDQAVATDGD